MFMFVLTILVVFAVLCLAELGWRRGWMDSELGRKAVHISVGSFVAVWPFFLGWTQIELLSVAFAVVIIISKALNVFGAIHSVQRPTYGEIFFALVVGAIALLTHSKEIYAAAVLQMSLADGLAAVIGSKYGHFTRYHVLGHVKSAVGTATFFVVSLAILAGYAYGVHADFSPAFVLIALGAALLENVAVLGLDNLLVPLFVAAALLFV